MYEHPYSRVFILLLWITPILICYAFKKSPVKYKLPKCYINFFIISIPIYFLGIIILSRIIMDKYDYEWYSKKYTPICMIICYIVSVLVTFMICKMEFKLPNAESKVLIESNSTKVLIKNNKVLNSISIMLLGISIYACSNIFFVGSLLACPIWGILFFLHFNPRSKEFIIANAWLFLTLCFLLFLFSSAVNCNNNIILTLTGIWSFASLASILLYNSYLVSGKKKKSSKSSYLFMLLFLLPFLLLTPLTFLYLSIFLYKVMSCEWNLLPIQNIPLHAQIPLIIFAAIFSYYWFSRLKKNILNEKSELI